MLSDTLLISSVICFVSVTAQFSAGQNFQLNGGRSELDRRRQLSPQQQGHILSDIQQHQHRFQLHQNLLKDNQNQNQNQGIGIGRQQAGELNPQGVFKAFGGFQQPLAQQNQQILTNRNNQGNLNNNNNDQNHPESLLLPQLPLVHQNHQFNSHTNGQPSQLNPQGHSNFLGQNQQINPSVPTPLLNQQNQFNQHLNGPTQASVQNQLQFQSNFLAKSLQPTTNPLNIAPSSIPLLSTEQSAQLNTYFDTEKQQQRLKELRLKQQIIDKHNQFVEKQYEKSLKKAQDDHQEWLENQREQRKKLYQSLYRPGAPRIVNYAGANPRYIFPEETSLFQQAVGKYYQEHPTTTTTTTTTTTPEPITTTRQAKQLDISAAEPELYLPKDRQQLFSQLKTSVERGTDSTERQQFLPTAIPEPKAKPIKSLEQLDLLQRQYQQQLLQRDDLLRQLKAAIAENTEDEPNKNYTSREISLSNGQTYQIIKTTDPKLVPGATPLTSESITSQQILQLPSLATTTTTTTTTAKPNTAFFEQLRGALPPGANYEVLKHNAEGGVEELGNLPANLPNQKKVTFVLLEEQQDGSYKVQGVRGNNNEQKDKEEVDVDSILMRIKNGEIKLPPPVRSVSSNEVSTTPTTDIKIQSTIFPSQSPKPTTQARPRVTITTNSNTDSVISNSNSPVITTNIGTKILPSSTQTSVRSSSIFLYNRPSSTPATVTNPTFRTSQHTLRPTAQTNFQASNFFPSSTEQIKVASTSSAVQKPIYSSTYGVTSLRPNPTIPTQRATSVSVLLNQPTETTASSEDIFASTQPAMPLADLLKTKGMFAMAKFLKQSGLDTILNETGPYTIFIPTDKAFRNLLIQLGGPEKAEEKFKENPRLLSGLLLHHVIPGAFQIKNLQDEMTGVSLAGTQLRVNQYSMQDVEWNEVKVTTINGAKVVDEKQDIEIPQGIAHAVDRVMFPLPVGDIVQTLQSDRERRFTTFLRILFASGLAETLQGTKTYTLFAPVDRAFNSLSSEQLNQLVTDKAIARDFVMRHTIPGTLYTNGMRYYQIRDTLQPDKQITINKNSGRIKINNNSIITQNVPATNGVIHAMDALL